MSDTAFLPDLVWFSATQAAQFLGCGRATVIRMIYAGEIEVIKGTDGEARRPYRIPRSELARLSRGGEA